MSIGIGVVAQRLAGDLIRYASKTIQADQQSWDAVNRVYTDAFIYMFDKVADDLADDDQVHLESVLREFIAEVGVYQDLVHCVLEEQEPSIENLRSEFVRLDYDPKTLLRGVSFETVMEKLFEGLGVAIKEEASRSDSPLTNLWLVSKIDRLRGKLDVYIEHVSYVEYASEAYHRFSDYLEQKMFGVFPDREDPPNPWPIRIKSAPEFAVANAARFGNDPLFNSGGIKREPRGSFGSLKDGFDYYNGRILVLGTKGGGKTFCLLQFGRDMALARLRQDRGLVPVFLLASTWDYQKFYSKDDGPKKLIEWIENSRYVPRNVASLIRSGLALLLLDGLDEVPSRGRVRVEREDGRLEEIVINPQEYFLEQIPTTCKVVITSNVTSYSVIRSKWEKEIAGAFTDDEKQLPELEKEELLAERIFLKQRTMSVLKLDGLDSSDIFSYMQGDEQLVRFVLNSPKLLEVMHQPLFLSLFRGAYFNQSLAYKELENVENQNELWNKVWERYIRGCFDHESFKISSQMKPNLTEFMRVFGDIALEILLTQGGSLAYFLPRRNQTDKLLSVVDHSIQFNLLVRVQGEIQFFHSSLRDYLAYKRAIKKIRRIEFVPSNNFMQDDDTLIDVIIILGDSDAKLPLIDLFYSTDNWLTRCRVIRAFGELGIKDEEPALIDLLSNEDEDIRAVAAMALGKLRSKKAVGKLIALLNDSVDCRWVDSQVCFMAAGALESIGTPDALDAVKKWADMDWDSDVDPYYE